MNDVYLIKKETLTKIADSIRANSPDSWAGCDITPEQMPDTIGDVYNEGYDMGYSEGTESVRLTNLKGTVWEIPAGWSAPAGYGKFEIDCDISYYDKLPFGVTRIGIGYNVSGNAADDRIQLDTVVAVSVLTPQFNLHILFTGGADTANTDLINWLYEFGKLQSRDVTYVEGYNKGYNNGYNEGYSNGQIVQYDIVTSSSTFTITVINNTDLKLTTHINVWCEYNTEVGWGIEEDNIIIEVEPQSSNSGSVTFGAGGSQHSWYYIVKGMEFLYVD